MDPINLNILCSVRGNLIRVVSLTNGEKLLIKGHSSNIIDMKFSYIDRFT